MSTAARSSFRLRAGSRFRRIFLEQLEDRSLLASVDDCSTVVANTNDAGAGSLRDAINCSNSTPGTQTISFNISGSGVHTITPTSSLWLTDAAIIDGFTQPGASPNTNGPGLGDNSVHLIELSGISGGGSTHGLVLDGVSGATIRGLVINRFGQTGIFVRNSSNTKIEGNFVGTDPTGSLAQGNTFDGIDVIGWVDAPSIPTNNVIGGSSPAARNIISGNSGLAFGIDIIALGKGNGFVQNTIIQGNFIGTDATGTLSLANTKGINVGVNTSGTMIGGANAGEGNLISGNGNSGIELGGAQNTCTGAGLTNGPSGGNIVRGNKIGTDVTGTKPLGNLMDGVSVGYESPSTTVIGGKEAGEGNIIAFNGLHGVGVLRSTTSILSNSIFSNTQLGVHLGVTG